MAAYCRLRHVGRLRRAALFSTVKTSVRGKQPGPAAGVVNVSAFATQFAVNTGCL